MGRKHRNARSRTFQSFNELRNASLRFDLSNGTFATKSKKRGTVTRADVHIYTGDNGRGKDKQYVTISIKDELALRLIKEYGKFWTCGVVSSYGIDRLYIIPDEMGFALYDNKTGSRHYVRVRVDETVGEFTKFIGEHELQFDTENRAYYVSNE